MIAVANKVVHNGGHKIKTGPLTKPYFLGFLGFPEPEAGSPFFSADSLTWTDNQADKAFCKSSL